MENGNPLSFFLNLEVSKKYFLSLLQTDGNERTFSVKGSGGRVMFVKG